MKKVMKEKQLEFARQVSFDVLLNIVLHSCPFPNEATFALFVPRLEEATTKNKMQVCHLVTITDMNRSPVQLIIVLPCCSRQPTAATTRRVRGKGHLVDAFREEHQRTPLVQRGRRCLSVKEILL